MNEEHAMSMQAYFQTGTVVVPILSAWWQDIGTGGKSYEGENLGRQWRRNGLHLEGLLLLVLGSSSPLFGPRRACPACHFVSQTAGSFCRIRWYYMLALSIDH
jgi:hypothetical protein